MMGFGKGFRATPCRPCTRSDRRPRPGLEELFSDPDVDRAGRRLGRPLGGLTALARALAAALGRLPLGGGQRLERDGLDRSRQIPLDALDAVHSGAAYAAWAARARSA